MPGLPGSRQRDAATGSVAISSDHGPTFGTDLVGQAGGIAPLVAGLEVVAAGTVERRTDPALPSLGSEHPGSLTERWAVAHVLAVTAFEEGDPVPNVVLLESLDGPLHG